MNPFPALVIGAMIGLGAGYFVWAPDSGEKPQTDRTNLVDRADLGGTGELYHYRATLIRVVDGDTVDLDIDLGFGVWLRGQRIRLAGIDAPEMSSPDGKRVKAWLEERLYGVELELRTIANTKGVESKEKYGRWLGVLLDGKKVINDELLAVEGVERY